ncbi:MAG TPA: hypothetical protein DCQ31_11745 [Bacteroidales bacterium]|nr:hypothetical protein [Bacteroidales bacterium]
MLFCFIWLELKNSWCLNNNNFYCCFCEITSNTPIANHSLRLSVYSRYILFNRSVFGNCFILLPSKTKIQRQEWLQILKREKYKLSIFQLFELKTNSSAKKLK